jgi:hypothetical protein
MAPLFSRDGVSEGCRLQVTKNDYGLHADLQPAVTQFAKAVRSRVPLGCDCAHWFSHEVSFAGQLFTQAVTARQSESPAHALSSLQQLCDTH